MTSARASAAARFQVVLQLLTSRWWKICPSAVRGLGGMMTSSPAESERIGDWIGKMTDSPHPEPQYCLRRASLGTSHR